MFGYIIPNYDELKIKDFKTYHAYYCGLCRSLRERSGVSSQISLTYDMTFLGLLFVLMIIFSQTIVISNLTRKCKRLTQEVGLLYKKVEDLEETVKEETIK